VSEIVYRDAVDSDAAAVANFARDTWLGTFGHLPYPPDDLRAYLAKAYGEDIQRAEIADPEVRYRLALRDGALVGYCMMGPLDMPVDDAEGMELYRIYVAENVKGAGVAAALMDDCIAWAKAKGASALYLSVWEENERAQRFYRRYGFEDFSEWQFMVGTYGDRDLIWRCLLLVRRATLLALI
jgi:ribosomal protein S18 acetylase RimI-like enzyme